MKKRYAHQFGIIWDKLTGKRYVVNETQYNYTMEVGEKLILIIPKDKVEEL